MNPMHQKKKAHSPYMFNPFNAEGLNPYNQNKANNLPVKVVGQKSNSLDKANNNKFWPNNNYSKYYCITLNQYAQIKKEHKSLNSLNSQSSSNSKNKNKNTTHRPSTAPQRSQNNKNKNKNLNDKKTDFVGFNGITNIRTNLISGGYDTRINNNQKYKIKENNINGFNNVFNPYNTFTNNILMSNGFNTKYVPNTGYNNKVLIGANNKIITSPKIVGKKSGYKNKRQNNGERIRLTSPNISSNIPLINKNHSQKHRK